jgi:hypothetical protein
VVSAESAELLKSLRVKALLKNNSSQMQTRTLFKTETSNFLALTFYGFLA